MASRKREEQVEQNRSNPGGACADEKRKLRQSYACELRNHDSHNVRKRPHEWDPEQRVCEDGTDENRVSTAYLGDFHLLAFHLLLVTARRAFKRLAKKYGKRPIFLNGGPY